MILTLVVLCMTITVSDAKTKYSASCNFENGTCGWVTQKKGVYPGRNVLVCGVRADLDFCYLNRAFQNADIWSIRRIHSINLTEVGFPADVTEMVYNLDDMFVLATTSFIHSDLLQMSDIVSTEILLSMEHRCLQYRHLLIGSDAGMAVAYITNYFEPYDFTNYLNTHRNSSFVKFSTSSAILPVGVSFKLVFRSLFDGRPYGLVFVDDIFITEGKCNSCGADEFLCSSDRNECVPFTKVCDFQPDCLGGEDEKHCDFESLQTKCRQQSMSKEASKTPSLNETNNCTVNENGKFFAPRLNICYDGEECESSLPNQCFLSCPENCSCSGLSFNCSSHSAPDFATSITLTGLTQDEVIFNEFYTNLQAIEIHLCKIDKLNISVSLNIEHLVISHSTINFALIDDKNNHLRIVRIENSSFQNISFSVLYNFDHKFEFFVHKSSVLFVNESKIPRILGVHVIMTETVGFPYIIQRFYHTVINFSYCNLTFQPDTFLRTVTLDLSHNLLLNWHVLSFNQILYLQHNLIEAVNFTSDFSASEARLQYLDLSYNKISVIKENDFVDLRSLLFLKIGNNHLVDVHDEAFSVLTKLIHLDLSNNNLLYLKRSHFLYLSNLQYLYIHNNNVKVVEGMFDGLISIQYLQVDSYTLCCAQPKAVSKMHCSAPINEISSCNNLIDTPLLGVIIWYIAFLAVFGNFLGLVYRGLVLKSKSINSFDLYSINLGFADLLMGIYLYIIAGANLSFNGRYGFEDDLWRHGTLCTFSGVLATLSSEASALLVLLITIDRIIAVRFPFSVLDKRVWIAKLTSGLVWAISFFLSLLPLFGSEYFRDYYSHSGICISLPLSVLRKPGWEYSMGIFVGANFLIFTTILIGQFIVFTDVVRMGKNLKSTCSAQKRREMDLAKTLIAVAVTDMLCWIPVGIIGLLTFLGIDVTSKIYAWVIVVVLPINSALNPIIYTFSAILRRRGQENMTQRNSLSRKTVSRTIEGEDSNQCPQTKQNRREQ